MIELIDSIDSKWTSTTNTTYSYKDYYKDITKCLSRKEYIQNYYINEDLTSTSYLKSKENWTNSTASSLYEIIYNTATTGAWYKLDDGFTSPLPQPTAVDRLRDIIRDRHSPRIVTRNSPVLSAQDMREVRARQTLRRVIGDDRFRQFLTKGFITVRAASGRVYQIFPGHKFTHVWENGVMINRLCVVLKGDFPPTDSIIMRFLLILNDENEFWKIAIKHGVVSPSIRQLTPDNRNLAQIFEDLKLRAA